MDQILESGSLLKLQQLVTLAQQADTDPEELNAAALESCRLARSLGKESELVGLKKVIENRLTELTPDVRSELDKAFAVADLQSGDPDAGLARFDRWLRSARIRDADKIVEYTIRMASRLQTLDTKDDRALWDPVMEKASDQLFLNAPAKRLLLNRMKKLELLDSPAPDISVTDVDGDAISLDDLRGKLVILDFWATNCLPCLQAFPNLQRLHNRYKNQGLVIIGISLDANAETVNDFRMPFGRLPWQLALSDTDADQTRTRYRVKTIPSLFIIDPTGKIVGVDPTEGDLRLLIQKFLP